MQFLSESERQQLLNMLSDQARLQNTEMDERGLQFDYHLVFEALHILADGIPERLYAILHAKGRNGHINANAGLTMLHIHRIAENGSGGLTQHLETV